MAADAVLAIVHHLAAFALVALLVAEYALARGVLDGAGIARFTRIDALYGLSAGIVIVAGIARILFGVIPADVYMMNLFFWIKMAALGAVALVSIRPTLLGIRWRRAAGADPAFRPDAGEQTALRRALAVELAIVPVIPIAAALMARGYGAL